MGRKQITLLPTGEAPEFAEGANFGEDGKLIVQELEVRGKGITVYDEDTGQPVCVKSKSLTILATEGKCDEMATSTPLFQ